MSFKDFTHGDPKTQWLSVLLLLSYIAILIYLSIV